MAEQRVSDSPMNDALCRKLARYFFNRPMIVLAPPFTHKFESSYQSMHHFTQQSTYCFSYRILPYLF